MEVGGTLQDSVMSYQLMHMYTALQCRHSQLLGQSCTDCLNEGIRLKIGRYHNGSQGLFLQSKQYESTWMSQVTWLSHLFPEFYMK